MQASKAASLDEVVGKVAREIEASVAGEGSPLTLAALSERAGIGKDELHRAFRKALGVTPRQYAAACRYRKLKSGLRGEGNVALALYGAGFGSSSRLYEGARGRLGMTPASYGKGGKGASVRYAIAATSLGRLLVAVTSAGVCAVRLGDSDSALVDSLRKELYAASVARDEKGLAERLTLIVSLLEEGKRPASLPVDIRATAFQCRVYEELLAIPPGETRTYTQVARAIGKPRAARAVGHACATNPLPLLVPCHRVVREDGSLGGYRFGLERKRALLDAEKKRKV